MYATVVGSISNGGNEWQQDKTRRWFPPMNTMSRKLNVKWAMTSLTTRLTLPTPLLAGYSVKLLQKINRGSKTLVKWYDSRTIDDISIYIYKYIIHVRYTSKLCEKAARRAVSGYAALTQNGAQPENITWL